MSKIGADTSATVTETLTTGQHTAFEQGWLGSRPQMAAGWCKHKGILHQNSVGIQLYMQQQCSVTQRQYMYVRDRTTSAHMYVHESFHLHKPRPSPSHIPALIRFTGASSALLHVCM